MAEVMVTQAEPCGMLLLRGAHGAEFAAAVAQATGAAFPARRQRSAAAGTELLWMSPDELLILCPRDRSSDLAAALDAALAGRHHLLADVGDMRARFILEGGYAREVLAKLTPADLSPAGLPVGEVRRTHLGQVAAAFWATAEGRFEVICFRSVADYMRLQLQTAAAAGPVGYFGA